MGDKPLLDVALGQKPNRTPVWFLRQAGRYLSEYREIRAKHSFLEVCKSPNLAKEITLQPLRRFDLDASIIFSDILIPCTGMGQDLTFDTGHGPLLSNPIRSAGDLKRLKHPDAQRELGFVGDAIAATKTGLKPTQTMIGFAGAPFTVASYMIEGRGTKDFTEVKKLMYRDPETFRGLLKLLSEVTVDYLEMQRVAGADILMLFDTWVGNISSVDYVELVLPVMQKLIATVRKRGTPVIYYPGQGLDKLAELKNIDMNVVAVDWRTSIEKAHNMLNASGIKCALQGNIDPQMFLGSEDLVRHRTRGILNAAQSTGRGHIFNVGHGLLPHTPVEAIQWCIEEVRKWDLER